MADGVGGLLIDTTEQCAHAVLRSCGTALSPGSWGEAAASACAGSFLIPRLVLNEVRLLNELARGWKAPPPEERFAERDLVCGMALSEPGSRPSAAVAGVTCRFCPEACPREFARRPGRFLGSAVGETGGG
jgi:trehalose synthase